MLAKRIIACLDIKDGKTVKGVNFENLIDAGDPVELAKRYSDIGIDELVFLDITATNQKRKTVVDLVERIAREIFIPFTVGGGIKTIDDIKDILNAGADKVSINSQAFLNPDFANKYDPRLKFADPLTLDFRPHLPQCAFGKALTIKQNVP